MMLSMIYPALVLPRRGRQVYDGRLVVLVAAAGGGGALALVLTKRS